MVGESLVGDGNEVAHIDLIIGPRGSAAETAFCNALTNNKDGFTALLAVVAPNLPCKPNTILFNKVTIKGAKQAVQMFGPAQHAVAKAVADSVAEGTIPRTRPTTCSSASACSSTGKRPTTRRSRTSTTATKESIERAVSGEPKAAEVVRRSATRRSTRSPPEPPRPPPVAGGGSAERLSGCA